MNNIIASEQVKVYNTGMSAQIAQTEAIAKNADLSDLKTWEASELVFANSLIQKGLKERKLINHTRLHRMLYLVYGYALVRHNARIGEFLFQPWDLGPAVERVFQAIQGYGAQPIDDYCKEFDPTDYQLKSLGVDKDYVEFYQIVDEVWSKYHKRKLLDISDEIKQPGGAWHKARIAHKPHLDIADIREEFIKLAK